MPPHTDMSRGLHFPRPAGLASPRASAGGTATAPAGDGSRALAHAPIGEPLTVVRIDGPAREELEREGVTPGARIVVAGRSPLGGPLVVQLGRARLAVAASIAVQVLTREADPGVADG